MLPFPSPRVVNLAGATLNALRYAPTPLGNPMARAIPEVAALEAESAAAAAATAAAAKPLKPAGSSKLATIVTEAEFLSSRKPRAAPAVATATKVSGPSPAAAAQAVAAPPPPPPPMNCSGVGVGGVGARRRRVMLLSHFYNEVLLLPHFVRHHAHMFDPMLKTRPIWPSNRGSRG